MKGDFCRMCGSKKLRRQKRDLYLEFQRKTIKAISIWTCENCGEEFLDDASQEKLYAPSRKVRRRRPLAA